MVIPTVMAAGRAGGMQIVIRSRLLRRIVEVDWVFNWKGMDTIIPKMDRMAIHPMNFNESEWKLNFDGLG